MEVNGRTLGERWGDRVLLAVGWSACSLPAQDLRDLRWAPLPNAVGCERAYGVLTLPFRLIQFFRSFRTTCMSRYQKTVLKINPTVVTVPLSTLHSSSSFNVDQWIFFIYCHWNISYPSFHASITEAFGQLKLAFIDTFDIFRTSGSKGSYLPSFQLTLNVILSHPPKIYI